MIPGIERPAGGFRLILADPPWRFQLYSVKGEAKAPQAHYDTMSTAAITDLPVEALAAENAVLLLWAVFPMLPDALRVIAAWGFEYRTGIAWAKQSRTGRKWAFGTGYIVRSAAELLLVGVRGKPAWQAPGRHRNLIVAPVREHSRKPDRQYELAEALVPGPRLELFARHRRPGWTSWGDQLGPIEATVDPFRPQEGTGGACGSAHERPRTSGTLRPTEDLDEAGRAQGHPGHA